MKRDILIKLHYFHGQNLVYLWLIAGKLVVVIWRGFLYELGQRAQVNQSPTGLKATPDNVLGLKTKILSLTDGGVASGSDLADTVDKRLCCLLGGSRCPNDGLA